MLFQGDVLATIAIIVGTCVSAWALTIAYGILFPARSEVAKRVVSTGPWKCIGIGALVVLIPGVVGLVLIKVPSPGTKLLGWTMVMAILLIAALGLAGIAQIAAERLRHLAPDMSGYASFSRATAFMIVGCILPVVGWLAFGPLLFLASLGAGTRAAIARLDQPAKPPRFEAA